MLIKQFNIKGFRSISDLSLTFNPDVNIIIGENNAGKTAIIDALRICLSFGMPRRTIYVDKDKDFYFDRKSNTEANQILFNLIFEIEHPFEAAVFTDFISQDNVDTGKQTIQLHLKYYKEIRNGNSILRWNVWGGDYEGQHVPTEVLQLLSFTYLDPLRNAVEKLRPHARGNKIAELYKHLSTYTVRGEGEEEKSVTLNQSKKDDLASLLQESVNNEEWSALVTTGKDKVEDHLKSSSIEGKASNIEFSFVPYNYNGIVDNISISTHVSVDRNFAISQNGLGENNLIYAATILGDLVKTKSEEPEKWNYFYDALIIEEPEAHLHPQKQNTFFKYLNQLKDKNLQLFITSHSPTITAKADLDYLIVLQKQDHKIHSFSMKESDLSFDNKKYLSKFLDVTKSQLFFSNGTILVEGISEALLLPVFARKLGYDLDRYGIEIVNIGGVSFEHFAKLYNNVTKDKRLLARCSVISDDDRGLLDKNVFIKE